MNIILSKIMEWGIYLYIFLLPYQARYFLRLGTLNGGRCEFLDISLYATDLLLLGLFFVWGIKKIMKIIVLKKLRHYEERSDEAIPFCSNNPGLPHLLREDASEVRNDVRNLILISAFILLSLGLNFYIAEDKFFWLFWFFQFLKIFLFIFLLKKSAVKWKLAVFVFLFSAIIQAILGFGQLITQTDLLGSNKWLGVASHKVETPGTAVVLSGDYRYLRAYGMFPHPNILGGFLALGLLTAIFWLFDFEKRLALLNEISDFKSLIWEIAAIFLALIFLIFGLISTFSRSAWLGFFCGFFTWTILFYLKEKKLGHNLKWFYFTILKFFIIGSLVFSIFYLIYGRYTGFRVGSYENRLEVKSISERRLQIKEAWELYKENWLVGIGLGNYTAVLAKKYPERLSFEYQPVHNAFILAVVELGTLGVLVILSLLYLGSKNLKKIMREPHNDLVYLFTAGIITILIISLFDHYFWSFLGF